MTDRPNDGEPALRGMTDAETAAHIRKRVADKSGHPAFAWPTDGCGYEQHIRFVQHRNERWQGGSEGDWDAFVLAYADSLDFTREPTGDTAKSEDRTRPPAGTTYDEFEFYAPGSWYWMGDTYSDDEAGAIAKAWAFVDKHYDRGFAAGRAGVWAAAVAALERMRDQAPPGERREAYHFAAAQLETGDDEDDALEKRDERMREEGRAAAMAAVLDGLERECERLDEHETIDYRPQLAVINGVLHYLRTNHHFETYRDSLAKREAAAEERGFERGRALYQNAWEGVGLWQSRAIDAERRIAELEAELATMGASLRDEVECRLHAEEDAVHHRRKLALSTANNGSLTDQRDALRADVARRELAAAKKALEDAAEDERWCTKDQEWLRERAAALQGDTDGERTGGKTP